MEKYYLAALSLCLGHAAQKTLQLLDIYGSASEAFKAEAETLLAMNLLTSVQAGYYKERHHAGLPSKLFDYCTYNRITVVTLFESAYPQALRTISHPPVLLYVRGQLPLKKNFLGIVGSRRATSYGLRASEELAAELAAKRLVIVSGGAAGVDAAAHRGALKAEGDTIAVMGCGIDRFYPAENKKLLQTIAEQGAVISEFAPGVEPLRMHFPMRNRIIVGLCKGVLVVEAALRSGAMITADLAIEAGREVYCLPGNIYSPVSRGTNALIKDGAMLVDCAEDILADYRLLPNTGTKVKIENVSLFDALPADEAERANTVLKAIDGGAALTVEEILMRVNLPLATLSGIILNLQISGLIREQPGQRYTRA